MFKLLGPRLSSMAGVALFLIPVSALLMGIVWFFGGVILRFHLEPLAIWRNTYLVLAVVLLGHDLFGILGGILFCFVFSKRLGLTFEDIREASMDFKLHKKKRPSEWTREWLVQELSIARAAKGLAEALFEAFVSR